MRLTMCVLFILCVVQDSNRTLYSQRNCNQLHTDLGYFLQIVTISHAVTIHRQYPEQPYESCVTGIIQHMYCECWLHLSLSSPYLCNLVGSLVVSDRYLV